jgi:hypothetical protein
MNARRLPIPPARRLRPSPHYRRAYSRLGTTGDGEIDRFFAGSRQHGRKVFEAIYGQLNDSDRRTLAAVAEGRRTLARLGIEAPADPDLERELANRVRWSEDVALTLGTSEPMILIDGAPRALDRDADDPPDPIDHALASLTMAPGAPSTTAQPC